VAVEDMKIELSCLPLACESFFEKIIPLAEDPIYCSTKLNLIPLVFIKKLAL
jgi:hypothetical protein